jgi:hypothetical protein
MKLPIQLRNTNRSHWSDAGIWLFYNLSGSLAPVWFGVLILFLFSRSPSLSDFSQHGEFALYSAAMFAPTLYVISRDLKIPGFWARSFLVLLTLLGILAATCFFVAVTTAFLVPKPALEINQVFLRRGTFGLFLFSAALSFLVTALDNARLLPDVRGITNQQQEQLLRQFDQLGGQK